MSATGANSRDGQIAVYGADLHLTLKRAGHLFLGGALTEASNAASVSGAIEIMNARGGPELMKGTSIRANRTLACAPPNSNGNGSLSTFGAQYDLSVARLVFGDLYRA